jgi:hypothetical protein
VLMKMRSAPLASFCSSATIEPVEVVHGVSTAGPHVEIEKKKIVLLIKREHNQRLPYN